MGKLVHMPNRFKNHGTIQGHREQSQLDRAIEKSKNSTGIDFYKLITGDQAEKQRYLMKQYQGELQEG